MEESAKKFRSEGEVFERESLLLTVFFGSQVVLLAGRRWRWGRRRAVSVSRARRRGRLGSGRLEHLRGIYFRRKSMTVRGIFRRGNTEGATKNNEAVLAVNGDD